VRIDPRVTIADMANTLATMITMTTYGTWLRGNKRGWVDAGQIFPPDPELEAADRLRMKHPPYLFPRDRMLEVGHFIGTSLIERLNLQLFALTVGTWHVHFVIGPSGHPIGDVVRCAKDAARYGLTLYRPIWTEGYDKRFCFDIPSARNRIQYVQRHNERYGLPPNPWPFLTIFSPR
jgi:hypothetical protein